MVKFKKFNSSEELVEYINYHGCEVISIDNLVLYYISNYEY